MKAGIYRYSDVPMELRPCQQPYPPLWYPTHNPESVQYAARHGFNFVGLGPAAAVREHIDAYRQTWELHRGDHGRLNGHVATPKLGVMRQVVSPRPMKRHWRSRARLTRTGIARSPSCGTTMMTIALMGYSPGRQRYSTKL